MTFSLSSCTSLYVFVFMCVFCLKFKSWQLQFENKPSHFYCVTHQRSRSKSCDLLAFSPNWSVPRINEPISLASPALCSNLSNYIWHVTSIISFISLPLLSLAKPHTLTHTHRRFCSLSFSYLCLQEMWATHYSIKTIFCTIDPTALVSPFCFFFSLLLLLL